MSPGMLRRDISRRFIIIIIIIIIISLPDAEVDTDTLNIFKSRLDKHWLDQDVLYNFYSELTGTGGALICIM